MLLQRKPNLASGKQDARLLHNPAQPQESSSTAENGTAGIITVIADLSSWTTLPSPKPEILIGEPIGYQDWKSSFYALIHQKNLTLSDMPTAKHGAF